MMRSENELFSGIDETSAWLKEIERKTQGSTDVWQLAANVLCIMAIVFTITFAIFQVIKSKRSANKKV
jgi:hypothetical protein